MNLYSRIRNTECDIPEEFDLKDEQVEELVSDAEMHDKYNLMRTAFKFGYIQGCRAEQYKKDAKGKKELIHRMVDEITDQARIDRIFYIVHANFIRDKEGR